MLKHDAKSQDGCAIELNERKKFEEIDAYVSGVLSNNAVNRGNMTGTSWALPLEINQSSAVPSERYFTIENIE